MLGFLRTSAVTAILIAGASSPVAAEKEALSQLTSVALKTSPAAVVVTLIGSKAPDFTSFTMSDPFRVVVDWAGSRLVGVSDEKRFDHPLIRRITTKQYDSEAEKISRVTVELARETSYHVEAAGKRVLVHFVQLADPIPAPQPPAAEPVLETSAEAKAKAKPVASAIPEGPLTEPATPVPLAPPPIPAPKKEALAAAPTAREPSATQLASVTPPATNRADAPSPRVAVNSGAASNASAASTASSPAAPSGAPAKPASTPEAVAARTPEAEKPLARRAALPAASTPKAQSTRNAQITSNAQSASSARTAEADDPSAKRAASAIPPAPPPAVLAAGEGRDAKVASAHKAEDPRRMNPTSMAPAPASSAPSPSPSQPPVELASTSAPAKASDSKGAPELVGPRPPPASVPPKNVPSSALAKSDRIAEPSSPPTRTPPAPPAPQASPASASAAPQTIASASKAPAVTPSSAASATSLATPASAQQPVAARTGEPAQPKPSEKGGLKLATFPGVTPENRPVTAKETGASKPAPALVATPAASPNSHATEPPVRMASAAQRSANRAPSSAGLWQPPSISIPEHGTTRGTRPPPNLPVVRVASAQSDSSPLKPSSTTPADAEEPARARGEKPAQTEAPSADANDADPGRRVMKYIGFRQMADVSRVFVRLDGKAKYKQSREGSTMVLELTNTAINVKNNERPLDTTYFNTAVSKVQAVRAGENTRVEVKLREVVPFKVTRMGSTIAIDFKRAGS